MCLKDDFLQIVAVIEKRLSTLFISSGKFFSL